VSVCTCAVEAVGMGAMSKELCKPWRAIRARSPGQSQRSDGATPHRSGCSKPSLAGDPAYDAYGVPTRSASSHEASRAAK